jgi:acetate kinase
MKILVLNSGSSSLKCKLFAMPEGDLLYEKTVEHIGEEGKNIANHHQALDTLAIYFTQVDVIGHRVVHGGEDFSQSRIIDTEVMQTLQNLIPLAPLHNPANIEGIVTAKHKAPHIPQVAVFDTAFHATLEKKAYMYALSYKLYEQFSIRRYGFHGTSHNYLMQEASSLLAKEASSLNLITLHLGNGASVCAIENGKSIDTSMGFTPLEGLVMGTRSGDIDPAIVLYLQRELAMSVSEVDTLLNKKSGLLGLCGENDVRNITQREDTLAKLAIDIMVRRIQKYIGSYMVLLEGRVDALVFSGGIGEHSEVIRKKVLDNAMFANMKSLVIETNEELAIARECYKIIK